MKRFIKFVTKSAFVGFIVGACILSIWMTVNLAKQTLDNYTDKKAKEIVSLMHEDTLDPKSVVMPDGVEYLAICMLPETMFVKLEGDTVMIYAVTCKGEVTQRSVPHPTIGFGA